MERNLAKLPDGRDAREGRRIAMMSNKSAVTFHLDLKRPANDHHCFAGSMPVERSDTSGGESCEDNRWSFCGVAALHSYRKTTWCIRNGSKFGGSSRSDDLFFFRPLCGKASQYDDARSENNEKHAEASGEGHDGFSLQIGLRIRNWV